MSESKPRLCHFEGAPARSFLPTPVLDATEKSTVRLLVICRDTPGPSLSGQGAAMVVRAAVSALQVADAGILNPAAAGWERLDVVWVGPRNGGFGERYGQGMAGGEKVGREGWEKDDADTGRRSRHGKGLGRAPHRDVA